jgi:diadenosine tetraphosphatase ApaH/serine/threonine PP2A family protein phosphatase
MEIDKHIAELLVSEKCLEESQVKTLCERVKNILIEEPNVLRLQSPIVVCGDIHGQMHDLRELLRVGNDPQNTTYLFMGDYVDRGYYSVETLELLLLYKLKYPNSFYLLRGNHESRQITSVYGFMDEIYRKYGNNTIWRYCVDVFDYMPIAAVIDNQYFCVHAGLSPQIKCIDEINTIKRSVEIPPQGSFSDLMWSDPEEIQGWSMSARGAGWLFGSLAVEDFNYINNIKMICRSHQLVNEGVKLMFDKKLVIVWSAPNYCYRCGNSAKIMKIQDNDEKYLDVQTMTKEIPPHYSKVFSYFL